MRKTLGLVLGLTLAIAGIFTVTAKDVKAGGSLATSFTIEGEDARDWNSWAMLSMEDIDFDPIIGRDYDFTITPDCNEITYYSITTDSKDVSIGDITDEILEGETGVDKHRKSYFYGEVGAAVTHTLHWGVKDRYGETADYDFTFSFHI